MDCTYRSPLLESGLCLVPVSVVVVAKLDRHQNLRIRQRLAERVPVNDAAFIKVTIGVMHSVAWPQPNACPRLYIILGLSQMHVAKL